MPNDATYYYLNKSFTHTHNLFNMEEKAILINSNNNYQEVFIIEERDDNVTIVSVDSNGFNKVAVNSNRIIKL